MNHPVDVPAPCVGPAGSGDPAAPVDFAVGLNRLEPADLGWLWPRRIPLGRLSLVIGDPGLGKSLVTLDVAARVSRGTAWPDVLNPEPRTQNPPAFVLLLNAEDDLADTVIPRLHAAGADCSRIVAIPSIVSPNGSDDADAYFILRRELARIEHVLDRLPDCRLVVVDPVSGYLAGSGNASGEVRRLLAPLAELARRRHLAVVAVSHLRKRDGAAIHRTLGSMTFVSAARAAWLVAADPTNRARRLLLPVKNNLAQDAGGLAFRIESTDLSLPCRDGSQENSSQPIIRWAEEPITVSADVALRPPRGRPRSERDDALHWLQRRLASGPLPSRQVQQEAQAHGIRLQTLRRAFRELSGEATLTGDPKLQHWLWRLPNTSPYQAQA